MYKSIVFARLLAALLLVTTAADHAMAVPVGHHTVDYLGSVDNHDGTSTAFWAVTENGCDAGSSSFIDTSVGGENTNGNGKGGGRGGGKGGTNCNSMSHAAFSDFLCYSSDLVWPDGTGEQLYWTVTDIEECINDTYACEGTVYKPNYGASRPDGPGDWVKFSNHTTEPETKQLSKGKTHVFDITFRDQGDYVHDGQIHIAIKIGRTVVIGDVTGPTCSLSP